MVLALKSNFKDEYSIEKFKEIVLADKYTEILKMREKNCIILKNGYQEVL